MAVALVGEAVKGYAGCGMRMGEGVQAVAREEALWDPCPESLDLGYPETDDGSYDEYDDVAACSGYEGENVRKKEKKRFASRFGEQDLTLCRHYSPHRVCASSDCHRIQPGQSQVSS